MAAANVQTDQLVMVGLGVQNDTPPNTVQPKLSNGIHLRWFFDRLLGYPWGGFSLFRRLYNPTTTHHLSNPILSLVSGSQNVTTLTTSEGRVTRGEILVVTSASPRGFDLAGTSTLVFDTFGTAYRLDVKLSFPTKAARVDLTAYAGSVPVVRATVNGTVGGLPVIVMEFDTITRLELMATTAVLVDVAVYRADEAMSGWQVVPGFTYPMRLPVSDPLYPCTPGAAEVLDASRTLAKGRILYGDPNTFTKTPVSLYSSGTVTVVQGSSIVTGSQTLWDTLSIGASLRIAGDATAYMIAAVITPGRLVLTRAYRGSSKAGVAYSINDDPFAELHDTLIRLVQGGPAAGTMVSRTLPMPVYGAGTIALVQGSTAVTGSNTSWTADLVGLALRVGSEQYLIDAVGSSGSLTLSREYLGATASGLSYTIVAPTLPLGVDPSGAPEEAPQMPQLLPLDLTLIGSLQPAVAQMLGLYFRDATVDATKSYDYLIVADHQPLGYATAGNPLSYIAALTSGVPQLYGYIVFNKKMAPAAALTAPQALRAYALPGGYLRDSQGSYSNAINNVGLRFQIDASPDEIALLPWKPILYHLWRADLGTPVPTAVPVANKYQIITASRPIVVATPTNTTPTRPPDWPSLSFQAIDRGLPDGYYSYKANAVDIFGRHSPLSSAAPWYKVTPAGEQLVHGYAVGLFDRIPPPPPTAFRAYALDPKDPLVLQDPSYLAWRQGAGPSQIGVRCRFEWPEALAQQAPDTREFRIYFQPGPANTRLGKTAAVTAATAATSSVATDIVNTAPADAYVGATLRAGGEGYAVLGSQAGTPLVLLVRNLGVDKEIQPPAYQPCSVVIPEVVSSGKVVVTSGSAAVTGTGTSFQASLVGMPLQIAGELSTYTVAAVGSPTSLTLDRAYAGASAPATGVAYAARHPLFVDYSVTHAWAERAYVNDYGVNVTVTTDDNGRPLRRYDVFFPMPGTMPMPALADPIVYGHFGITAADDKAYTLDDAKWTGAWGNRYGNESGIGMRATVVLVLRAPPDPPSLPVGPERLYASPADYHGDSYFTFRWAWTADVKVQVYRALDDTLFRVDWARRAASTASSPVFPPDWNQSRHDNALQGVTDAGNNKVSSGINDLPSSGTLADALVVYRKLGDDALRVLASLLSNEAAFSQRTIQALDGDADRLGPDSDAVYMPDGALRSFRDKLPGRAGNVYFYRVAAVDGAHNQGPMSLAAPPLYLRKVVAPRAPRWAGAEFGDGSATVSWVSLRDADLKEYRLFRALDPNDLRNPGSMPPIQVLSVAAGDPQLRAALVGFLDEPLVGGTRYYYSVVAVDNELNVSLPSEVLTVQAVDTRVPDPPVWLDATWVALDAVDNESPWPQGGNLGPDMRPALRLVWESDVLQGSFKLSRRARGAATFKSVAGPDGFAAIQPDQFRYYDTTVSPAENYSYRLLVTSAAGVTSIEYRELETLRP